jgi:hypothetical protein
VPLQELIQWAGWAIAAFFVRKFLNDLKGMSRRDYRIIALLVRWAETEEKRDQVADLIEGK